MGIERLSVYGNFCNYLTPAVLHYGVPGGDTHMNQSKLVAKYGRYVSYSKYVLTCSPHELKNCLPIPSNGRDLSSMFSLGTQVLPLPALKHCWKKECIAKSDVYVITDSVTESSLQ